MDALATDLLGHFRLVLWNHWTDFPILERKQKWGILHQIVVLCRSKTQYGRPGLWLAKTSLTSCPTTLNGIWGYLTGSKFLTSSTSFVGFVGFSEKRDGRLGIWFSETFLRLPWNHWTEFDETWQEARPQDPLSSLCFRADRKNKMTGLSSDWLSFFDFCETAECNLLKLDRKLELNVIYQVCVFRLI